MHPRHHDFPLSAHTSEGCPRLPVYGITERYQEDMGRDFSEFYIWAEGAELGGGRRNRRRACHELWLKLQEQVCIFSKKMHLYCEGSVVIAQTSPSDLEEDAAKSHRAVRLDEQVHCQARKR